MKNTHNPVPESVDAVGKEREPKNHVVKCWIEFFPMVVDKTKRFEVRFNDRDYRKGDTLTQQAYDNSNDNYVGGETIHKIDFVLYGPAFGIEAGYCVMSLSDLTPQPPTSEPTQSGSEEIIDNYNSKKVEFDKSEDRLLVLISESGNEKLMDEFLKWQDLRTELNRCYVDHLQTIVTPSKNKIDHTSTSQPSEGMKEALELSESVKELLQVKQWKDEHGKDEHYLKAQPTAWINLKESYDAFLFKYDKL